MKRCLLCLLLLGFLTTCSTTQSDPTSTPIPPTQTSEPPTPTLVEDPIFFGEVTFDGNECTVEGPEEVSRGVYYFILNDESDKNLQLWINQLLEGKTFDDLLDWQEEPGVYRPAPPWIDHPHSRYSTDVEMMVHYLDNVGNYAILVGGYHPSSLWFCEPFKVVEVDA